MPLRRPTVAFLLFVYLISPLCGVAQTTDWGMLYILSFRGVALDTRSVHSIFILWLHIHVLYEQPACVHHGFCLFRDRRYDHRIFRSMIIPCYIIPVFIMFASTFKVLTGLYLAIVLARFLARRGATWWQPRNLSNGDSSLVKIGVNLVSCSRGKWSPIDTDDPQTASAINH